MTLAKKVQDKICEILHIFYKIYIHQEGQEEPLRKAEEAENSWDSTIYVTTWQ